MYLLLQKLFLFLLILNFTNTLREDLVEVRKLLVRNDTKRWLDGMEFKKGDSPYCKLCCVNITANSVGKICGVHTLCRYPEDVVGPSCKGYISVKFTKEEKDAILEIHNALRNKVASGLETRGNNGPQPTASNMRMLIWSDELETIAERWGAQCIFSHDKCRDTADFPVGQNLARGNIATNNELSLIVEWYDEVTMFNHEDIASFVLPSQGDHPVQHYTQIIWADTYQLGCARAIFQHFEEAQLSYKEHLICNYGPSGNIPKQPVYKTGKPCTSCPEGTVCSIGYAFSGLCEHEKFSLRGKKFVKNESNVERRYFILLFIYVLNVNLCLYLFR